MVKIKELYNERCSLCKGTGQIYKQSVCTNCNGKTCYKCEVFGACKVYIECSKCYGCGEVYYDIKTRKQVVLNSGDKYKIIPHSPGFRPLIYQNKKKEKLINAGKNIIKHTEIEPK